MRTSLALATLALTLPAALGAQTRTTFAAFASADEQLGGAHVGGSLARETRGLGWRAGAAIDALPAREGLSSGWSVDVDAVAHAGALLDALDGVRLFAGVGARHTLDTRLDVNVGGLYSHPIAGPLALDTEVRYRTPLLPRHEPIFEFRVGVSLGFGGRAAPRATLRTTGMTMTAAPIARPTATARAGSSAATAFRVIESGERHLGVRYQWGGNTPEEGFDCSGFLRYIFREHGVELPRVSRDQARAGEPVALDLGAFQPGDLLFFARDLQTIDHAAVYVGGGQILHSSSSGRGVRYDDLNSQRGRYYRNHMVAARRVLAEGEAFQFGVGAR
jgi:cell wall-associated NlpC family hydrolase